VIEIRYVILTTSNTFLGKPLMTRVDANGLSADDVRAISELAEKLEETGAMIGPPRKGSEVVRTDIEIVGVSITKTYTAFEGGASAEFTAMRDWIQEHGTRSAPD
jgi:hypothetical protein